MIFLCSKTLIGQIPTLNPFFFGKNSLVTNVVPSHLTSIGQFYADEEWNAGNIFLKNGDSLVAYYMRYDLVRNHLEVIIDTKIVALNGSFIDQFEWFSVQRLKPERFINKDHFHFTESEEIYGFSELLEDGEIKLLKSKVVFAPQRATSPTLVNSTDEKIQVIEKFFIEKEDVIYEVSGSKKKNLEILNSKELKEYIKGSNLHFTNENDLRRIIKFVNVDN
ncbi:hypothetical protein [Ekhidna sp.]